MTNKECDIGLEGAGVMGGNLALNMAGHGFSVAVYDVDAAKTGSWLKEMKAGAGSLR